MSYDFKSAYHQIPLIESDKPLTAFETGGEFYEFNNNGMSFEVTNGGPVFQRQMKTIINEE